MVGEARRAGMIGQEEAASLTDIPNISQKGTRLGNWLNREQAKELLGVVATSNRKPPLRILIWPYSEGNRARCLASWQIGKHDSAMAGRMTSVSPTMREFIDCNDASRG
jgi:hypothetical protein